MLRLQAQFPSTVSTVYRCVFVPGSGSVGTELTPLSPGGLRSGRSQALVNRWCPCALSSHFQDE